MAKRRWVRVTSLTKEDKAEIAARCERFSAEVLVPRFLPEIRPTQFNYPVALSGKWRGDKYSFIQRYRSGFPDNAGEEFDAAFARLDHVGGNPNYYVAPLRARFKAKRNFIKMLGA